MIPEQAMRLHEALSPRAKALLEAAEREPERFAPLDPSSPDAPGWLTEYPYSLQPWPLFVEGAKLREMRRAALAVSALVRAIPKKIFGNNPRRIAEFYELDNELAAMAILKEPTGIGSAMARGDFFDTPEGFKCMELNVTATLGGWELRLAADHLQEPAWIRELVEQGSAPARYTDPLPVLCTHFLERIEARRGRLDGPLNLAFLFEKEGLAGAPAELLEVLGRSYQATLEDAGLGGRGRLLFATYDQLERRARSLMVDGQPVEAVIEFHERFNHPLVVRSFKLGIIDLYNGPVQQILDNKRNLALLSEHAGSERFDDAERQAIQQYIPWTRLLRSGEVDFHGETVSLPDFVIRERETLVIKHCWGMSGVGVHIGWTTPQDEWRQAVREALDDGHWIVQERVHARPYWFPCGDGQAGPFDLVWGLFAFGERYGGGYLRMMPRDVGTGVINSARGATQGLILEIDPPQEAAVERETG